MATDHKVYMEHGLHQHAISYLRKATGCSRKWCTQAWNKQFGVDFQNDSVDNEEKRGLEQLTQNMKERYDQHPLLLLRFLLGQHSKRFSFAPLRAIRHHFIVIGKRNLRQWGFGDNCMQYMFPERGGFWGEGEQIKTDGTRSSLTYVRNRDAASTPNQTKTAKKRRHDTRTVDIKSAPKGMYHANQLLSLDPASFEWEAFDPGMTNLYEGHLGTHLSRKSWRARIGAKRNNTASVKRNHRVKHILEALSEASLKTGDLDQLKQSIKVYLEHWTELWAHFGHNWWAQQRFRVRIKKQRVLSEITNEVLGKDRQKVAVFGDGVFAGSMKGLPPAPVTAIRDHLARHGKVVLVDEYLTSQVCSHCDRRMTERVDGRKKPIAQKGHRNGKKRVHGVFHCKSGCKTTWNRDENAALNIARIFIAHLSEQPRPEALCRPSANTTRAVKKRCTGLAKESPYARATRVAMEQSSESNRL
jgi:hypothetical protein